MLLDEYARFQSRFPDVNGGLVGEDICVHRGRDILWTDGHIVNILKQSSTYVILLSETINMELKLISATPSPYARKVRISLAEKGIPFELQTEVPWDSTTKTPEYNPLEKLPVLILDDDEAIYESHFILDWLEVKYDGPEYISMYPHDKDQELFAKKVQVVADGMCDALVLMIFEKQREQPSKEWNARQLRKVNGGLKALSDWVGDKDYIIDDKFSLADIAAGSVLGYMKVRYPDKSWQETYPNLFRYSENLDKRQSFKDSMPYPQTIKDKIV